MKTNRNTNNPKNRNKLTPFERLGMRRPNPTAADNWWYQLHVLEKCIFHWFVRATQVATDAEALEAVATFRDLDATMLHSLRADLDRAIRRQKRLARARQSAPENYTLTA